MADTKITALTAITTVDPAADVLPIVDVSDTSMAASGTTKKITSNQILGAGGTATLASATITGALTVDTTTLVVNPAGYPDRVGIGTASPITTLDVVSTATRPIGISNNLSSVYVSWKDGTDFTGYVGSGANLFPGLTRTDFGIDAVTSLILATADVERHRITSTGVATWSNVGGVAGTAMTLNATGLGVGTSPSYKLDVNGVARVSSGGDGVFLSSAPSPDLYVVGVNYYNNNGTEGVQVSARPSWKIEHKNSNDALAYLDIGFRAASAAASAFTSRFKIDGSGNVGIGVTPSAWGSNWKANHVGTVGSFASSGAGSAPPTAMVIGAYNDNTNWKYQFSSTGAARYEMTGANAGSAHAWYISPGGTVNNNITFTQAMTLTAGGELLVGKTASSATTVGVQAEPAGALVSTLAASTNATNTLICYSTGAAAYRFYVGLGGTVYATNTTISAISDARLKENVQDIDVGLGAILALKPRKFDWKDGKGKDIKGDRGFIAQEFEQVFPQLVDEWKDAAPEGEAPYKSVRQDLIPVLVKAIQELAARVQTLETR